MVKNGTDGAKKIILAIGNPGKEYENTYHNAGVLALESILQDGAQAIEFKTHKKLFEYAATEGAIFVRSLTFMNESGKAAREALKKFGAKPEDLIVLQDDSDIALGEFKMSFARNSAGHKGIQSIIDALGTKEFTRARIGIRPPQAGEIKRQKAGEFALRQITARNKKILATVFIKISSSLFS